MDHGYLMDTNWTPTIASRLLTGNQRLHHTSLFKVVPATLDCLNVIVLDRIKLLLSAKGYRLDRYCKYWFFFLIWKSKLLIACTLDLSQKNYLILWYLWKALIEWNSFETRICRKNKKNLFEIMGNYLRMTL